MAIGIPWKTGQSATLLSNFCVVLFDSQIGTAICESLWVFPIIEGSDLLGIALSGLPDLPWGDGQEGTLRR